MGSYVPTTAAEREEMLAAIGVDSLEGLYKAVPQEMLLRSGGLNIPEGLSNPSPPAKSLSPATPPIRRRSARAFCRVRLNSRR